MQKVVIERYLVNCSYLISENQLEIYIFKTIT